MHHRYRLFFCIFLGVLLGYFFTPIDRNIFFSMNISQDLSKFNFNIQVFQKIFVNNIIVGLLISIGGYFSYGILSFLILFWNGLSLGSLITIFHNLKVSVIEFISMLAFHGLTEFYALILFGIIGMKGVNFYKRIFNSNTIMINLKFKEFVLPTLLIFISAIIETILISNF